MSVCRKKFVYFFWFCFPYSAFLMMSFLAFALLFRFIFKSLKYIFIKYFIILFPFLPVFCFCTLFYLKIVFCHLKNTYIHIFPKTGDKKICHILLQWPGNPQMCFIFKKQKIYIFFVYFINLGEYPCIKKKTICKNNKNIKKCFLKEFMTVAELDM